jgi:hypothetical protein
MSHNHRFSGSGWKAIDGEQKLMNAAGANILLAAQICFHEIFGTAKMLNV